MKPSQIITSLTSLVEAGQPVMIWGPPGVGKSQTVAQVAQRLKRQCLDLRLPLLDSVDLRGIPFNQGGKTVWVPPSFLPRAGKGILFLDEIPGAPSVVQSAASSLILDRRIGEYELPEGWDIVGAGNRETDRANTYKMPSHIANRFTHLQYEVDFTDWCDHAMTSGFHPSTIAFISMRPDLLHQFDPSKKAYPTPRSWEFVSRIMTHNTLPDGCFREVIAGTVGEGAAVEFTGFFRVYRDLPEFEEIVDKPTKAKVPDNAAALYAVSTMLAVRGAAKYAKAVFAYLARLPQEFQITTVRLITKKNLDVAETQAYIQWQVANKDLYLNRPNAKAA